MEDLSYANVYIPQKPVINIINQLKIIPRTGKLIRLNSFDERIRIRTIYDHIIALSKSADILLNEITHHIKNAEIVDLAKCIVYHDLCEALLGDIPAYTNIPTKGKDNRLTAERLLRRWDSKTLKETSNKFISLFLEVRERSNLEYTNKIIYGSANAIAKFFNLLDKTDPIISVWRYINYYRENENIDINKFILRLKDFFENQKVKEIASDYNEDKRIELLINNLMDRNLARKFFHDKNVLTEILSKSGFDKNTEKLIYDVELFYSGKIYTTKTKHKIGIRYNSK